MLSDQKKRKVINDGQSKAFAEAAKSLECDESEERFDKTLKKVAQHKPIDEKKPSTEAPRQDFKE